MSVLHDEPVESVMTPKLRLMPVEPTDRMLDDGREAINASHKTGAFGECPGITWGHAEECWKAMLSTAQPPDADAVRGMIDQRIMTAANLAYRNPLSKDMRSHAQMLEDALVAAVLALLSPEKE